MNGINPSITGFSSISAVNSFDRTDITAENRLSKMKQLINAVEIYQGSKSEDQIIILNQRLQVHIH